MKKFKVNLFKILITGVAVVLSIGIFITILQTVGIDITWILKLTADSQRLEDVKQIRKALKLYYQDNNHYPITNVMCSSWHEEGEEVKYIPDIDEYLPKQPHDPEERPKSCPDYCYSSTPDGSEYLLNYHFKERNDKRALGEFLTECGNYARYEVCGKEEKCALYKGLISKRVGTGDTQRLQDIEKIQQALKLYYQDNNHYPITNVMCSSWHEEGEEVKYIPDIDEYLPKQPHDPEERPKSCPDYCYYSDGQSYVLDYYLMQRNLKENPGEEKGECGRFARYGVNEKD